MDWKFIASQVINIVFMMLTAMLAARYQRVGSFGLSQGIKDRLIATILAALIIGWPLVWLIYLISDFYVLVLKSPDQPATRADAAKIALRILYLHVLIIQIVYGIYFVRKGKHRRA